TEAGRDLFPDPLHIFQWHGEGFDLPAGAERLAATEWYPNQAMRVGGNAYGLQFHPEVTGAMMQRWSTMAGHRLVLPGAQARDVMREGYRRFDAGISAWLDGFLDKWLGAADQHRGGETVGAVAAGGEAEVRPRHRAGAADGLRPDFGYRQNREVRPAPEERLHLPLVFVEQHRAGHVDEPSARL